MKTDACSRALLTDATVRTAGLRPCGADVPPHAFAAFSEPACFGPRLIARGSAGVRAVPSGAENGCIYTKPY